MSESREYVHCHVGGYVLQECMPVRVIVVIPVYNRKAVTLNCLRQLAAVKTAGIDLVTVVVDDASTDGTAEAIASEFPATIVLRGNGSLWWTGAINEGVQYALSRNSDYVLFLNDDLRLDDGFIKELHKVASQNPNALVGAIKLTRVGNRSEIVTSGLKVKGPLQKIVDPLVGRIYQDMDLGDQYDCDILGGAALLVPTGVFRQLGLLDQRRFPHNWSDFEFARRASTNGYRCVVATRAHVYTDKDNPNYHYRYLVESSRKDYLKNLFNNHKFNYGFGRIWAASFFMHRPLHAAIAIYLLRMVGAIRWTLLKLLFPRGYLMRLTGYRMKSAAGSTNSPD